MNRDALRRQLVADEGLRLKPYRDSVGVLTIGVGRNLDANGISVGEAHYLLENDIDKAARHCMEAFPWFDALDDVRQGVLVNMCFNLGISGLRSFKRTLAAVEQGEYVFAAGAMLDSKWARQVGQRAVRLAREMETGEL